MSRYLPSRWPFSFHGACLRLMRVPQTWECEATRSVRHGVGHDVDPHRVRFLGGEFLEIIWALSLSFPAVAQVGVVADDRHHPALVVEDALVVDRLRAGSVVFPGQAAPLPGVDAGDLRFLLEAVDAAEDLVVELEL